jgi:hypothetical protein
MQEKHAPQVWLQYRHPEAGDKVTVGLRPLRDGGSLVFVITADGKSYGAKPSEAGHVDK